MALEKCTECGKEVSTSAKLCPYCGKKNPTDKMGLAAKLFLAFIVFAVVRGLVFGESPSDKNSGYAEVVRQKEADPAGQAKAEWCYVRAIKEAEALTEAFERENPGRSLDEKKVAEARRLICMAEK